MKESPSLSAKIPSAFIWLALAACFFVNVARGTERLFTNDWQTVSPEQVGLDSRALVEMFNFVREHEVPAHSVQIVRHNRLVLDAYFHPYDVGMRHDVASVTKSITSTLVGMAIDGGFLQDAQQTVLSGFKGRTFANVDARKQKLTLEHLLTMQAGWDCGVDMKDPRINVDARLAEMRRTRDWVQFALDLPMVLEPGIRFAYCNANCHLLSALLTQRTGTNALGFARRELFEPLGIRDVAWPADPEGHSYGWSDLQLHPRDMAKLGQLFLQGGRWGGHQIVPGAWLRNATRAHVADTGNNDGYGYNWWVPGERFPGVFEAVGRGGQRITVWPAKDLVLVFTGGGFETGDLATFILKALKSDDRLPPNLEASSELQKRIAVAAQPPLPRPTLPLPGTAEHISGKTFRFSANNLDLGALTLKFNHTAEAHAELEWAGHRMGFSAGLDGVERFSTNPLVKLPQAAKGQWLNDNTFLLNLDLVGGINFYRIKLTFSDEGTKVNVALSERTGLNEEQFSGSVLR